MPLLFFNTSKRVLEILKLATTPNPLNDGNMGIVESALRRGKAVEELKVNQRQWKSWKVVLKIAFS